MQTKPKDVPYCGVDKNKITFAETTLNKKNTDHLFRFILDRYEVHVKKDVEGLPGPWTDNKVICDYRFTNVRREHDRESKWLIEHISTNPLLSMEEKILNTFLFRTWNKSQTMEILEGPWTKLEMMKKESFRETIEAYTALNPKYVWYTNVFNCGGLKHSQKFPDGEGYSRAYREENAKKFADWEACMPLRMFHIPPQMEKNNIVDRIMTSRDQKEVFETIKEVRGFADFLAYQVFVDLTYIPEFPFSENEFTIAGPGCKKGLDLIFEDKAGMNYEECLFYLRDYAGVIFGKGYSPMTMFSDLPVDDRQLSVMSIENLCCELSKYIKAAEGTGRPRNKYKTPTNQKALF